MSLHSKAEKQLARKYGPDAWEWMPHWGKVRNRLSQRNYERYNSRMLIAATVVPAVVSTIVIHFISAALIR